MPPQQPVNPYQQPGMTPVSTKKGFNKLLVPVIVLVLLLLVSLGFGFWAFMERQDYKNNVEPKIDAAVKVAVQEESSRKDNEFVEKEKNPLKAYTGPETYGSLVIKYPKTWSAYVIEKDQNSTPLDGYLHPNVVPDITGKTAFALRIQVVNRAYDQELKSLEGKVKSGKVKVSAYKPKNVANVTGSRLTGEINTDEQSIMVLLPLRDKTLKIWTESTSFSNDFDNIILANLTFVP